MKKPFFFILAAAALLGTAAPASAQADPTYEAEDLMLFFRNPEGAQGTTATVGVSLGSTWNIFRRAATPTDASYGSTINLGNIGVILTQTYGADWTGLPGSLFAGAVGNSGSTTGLSSEVSDADYARTVYITKLRTGAGTIGVANSSGAAAPPNNSAGIASAIAGGNSSLTTSPAVLASPVTAGYNPLFNGNPATAYTAISGGVMGSLSTAASVYSFGQIADVAVALDLYRVTPVAGASGSWEAINALPSSVTGGSGYYLGTITLTRAGDIYFTSQGATAAVPPAPVITSGTTANGQVGTAFSYQITASNSPTSYAAAGLPPGLSVNETTGLISGAPTAAGTTNVTISATNPGGTDSKLLTLTITPGEQSIIFTQPSARPFSPNGRVNLGATANSGLPVIYSSSNPKVVTVANNILTIMGAGQATITASQPGNTNYSAAPNVQRTLTINKASQTITFPAPKPPKFRKGAKFTLTATATSKLPVTFVSSNPRVLRISGRTATIVGKGPVTITASQKGNANYTAASNVARKVTIK